MMLMLMILLGELLGEAGNDARPAAGIAGFLVVDRA